MGHGDEILLADGHYPAKAHARQLLRCEGLGIVELLASIVPLLPLDTYVAQSIALMEVVPGDPVQPTIWKEYFQVVANAPAESQRVEYLERFAFYERG